MREKGFTLIELTLVVVVVSVLASVAMIKYGPVTEKAYSAEAFSMLAQIVSAENAYQAENSSYTTDLALLDLDNTASMNFNYSINAGLTYAEADRTKTNKAKNNYYMCLNGGKQTVGSPTATVSCP